MSLSEHLQYFLFQLLRIQIAGLDDSFVVEHQIARHIGNAEFPFRLFNHPEIIIIKLTQPLEKE